MNYAKHDESLHDNTYESALRFRRLTTLNEWAPKRLKNLFVIKAKLKYVSYLMLTFKKLNI